MQNGTITEFLYIFDDVTFKSRKFHYFVSLSRRIQHCSIESIGMNLILHGYGKKKKKRKKNTVDFDPGTSAVFRYFVK